MQKENDCCNNCTHCIQIPRNNKYGDTDYLCTVSSYFISDIYKDVHNIKRYSPGGRILDCRYKRKKMNNRR